MTGFWPLFVHFFFCTEGENDILTVFLSYFLPPGEALENGSGRLFRSGWYRLCAFGNQIVRWLSDTYAQKVTNLLCGAGVQFLAIWLLFAHSAGGPFFRVDSKNLSMRCHGCCFMSFGTAPSLVAALSLWRFSGLAIAASFYLPSKCVRYFWLRLWHSTSSMKLHFVHFLPMLTLPWRNSRALIVTDANTRSFLLNGSCEHAHRLHSFIKNKSLSTNLNRKLPRLSDLCFTNFITPIQTFYQNELRSRCFIVVIAMPPVLASRVSVATCATRILLLTC